MERSLGCERDSGLRIVVDRLPDRDPDREDDGGDEEDEHPADPPVHVA